MKHLPAARLLLPLLVLGCYGSAYGPMMNLSPPVAKGLLADGEELHRDAPMNTESYDEIVENPFFDPRRDPLSTFSVDVDTAAYSNLRRLLAEGQKPPRGAVRIEEYLNYFSYEYPDPTGDVPFSVSAEIAECPWSPNHRLVHLGLQGRRISGPALPDRNLVFLLDVSGSMSSADKLPLVQRAMRLLVTSLSERDHVGIVVYAGASGVVLEPTPGNEHEQILDAIEALEAGGSTNAGEGIQVAYDMARRHLEPSAVNRVILATDGDFNVGITSRSDLLDLIEKERSGGVFLTVLGVGGGNLRDSQMEMLADHGNGNYAYIDSISEARKVLIEEAGGTLVTIAKDVKIQVEWNPARVGAYRLIGYENRLLHARDFEDDEKDAGEIGAGHSVTAIYEIAPPGEAALAGRVPDLEYQESRRPAGGTGSTNALTVKVRYKEPNGSVSRLLRIPVEDPGPRRVASASRDYRFSAAVAAFGLILRDSAHKGSASFGMVTDLARSAIGQDPYGHRKEFLTVVDTARKVFSRD